MRTLFPYTTLFRSILTVAIATYTHTGTASSADFEPEDIKRMPFKIRQVYRDRCTWMANRSFFEEVSVMRTEDGGPGTGQFLYREGLAAGDPATLVGKPALESEFFPDHINQVNGETANTGDPLALFGDWNEYWIIDRLNLQLRILGERYADDFEIGYRYWKRYTGAPVRLEPWIVMVRS